MLVGTRQAACAQYSKSSRREVVGAIEHVDGVELEPAHVFHEAAEPSGGEAGRSRPVEVLALEEKRGDGAERNGQT